MRESKGFPVQRKRWNEYWMEMAFMASTRGTCPRLQVGCIIVKDNEVISMGYNGAPSKYPDCLEKGCMMEKGGCTRTVHAEANALLRADYSKLEGAHLYCTDYPCSHCARMIRNTGITQLYYCREYRNPSGAVFLMRLSPQRLEMPASLRSQPK